MSKTQESGFKKTLRNMLRGKPATNKDVAERRKSPVERKSPNDNSDKKRRKNKN
jgi:hypothetical protein